MATGTILAVAAVVSALAAAGGAAYSAHATREASNYQAKVAEINNQIANDNAKRELLAGQIAAQDADFEAAQAAGELVARQGASGLRAKFGSSLGAFQRVKSIAKTNALRIRQQSEIAAHDQEIAALGFRAQRDLAKASATNAVIAGGFNVVGSLAGGVSSIAGNPTTSAAVGLS